MAFTSWPPTSANKQQNGAGRVAHNTAVRGSSISGKRCSSCCCCNSTARPAQAGIELWARVVGERPAPPRRACDSRACASVVQASLACTSLPSGLNRLTAGEVVDHAHAVQLARHAHKHRKPAGNGRSGRHGGVGSAACELQHSRHPAHSARTRANWIEQLQQQKRKRQQLRQRQQDTAAETSRPGGCGSGAAAVAAALPHQNSVSHAAG